MPQGWLWAVIVTTMAVINAEKTIYFQDDATPGMMQLEEFISNNNQAVSILVTHLIHPEHKIQYYLGCLSGKYNNVHKCYHPLFFIFISKYY